LTLISRVDSIGIPSRDTERSRRFYVETLGLQPDDHAANEFWVGQTCFAIWEPERFGMTFEPMKNGVALLRVNDVEAARAELERAGVEFKGDTFDTGVCHMAPYPDGVTP
jgi:catechol 2,3-dioxygenase-like lactoylglutathione lyase family enzyme